MKIKNIMLILTLSTLIIPLVNADFYACFDKGQQYSFCNPKVNYNRCGNYDHCTCESDGGNCGPICMSEYDEEENCYNQGYPWSCSQSGSCTSGGSSGFDEDAPEITLNSPVEGEVYDSRSVLFDIELDEKGDAYYYDNINGRGRWMRLFRGKNTYSRKRSLKDGFNNITIKAKDGVGNEAYKTVTFIVDSKKPSIRRTYPKRNDYTDGNFLIQYTEENLKDIKLYVNDELVMTKTSDDCPAGSKQECEFYVDELEQGELEYYFDISDYITTTTQRRPVTAYVDTVDPEITLIEPEDGLTYPRRVPFDIKVSEEAALEYKDTYDRSPDRYRRLCSRCDEYKRTRTFRKGPHELTIRATDTAGNEDFAYLSFDVDY